MNSDADAQSWFALTNLNFNLLNSVELNLISTKSPVEPLYSPVATNSKSSPLSDEDAYISTCCANPLPLDTSCLAAYTILFKVVISLNVTTTSFVKFSLFGFPVSQWVLRLPSIALSIGEFGYVPPLLVIDLIFELSILNS